MGRNAIVAIVIGILVVVAVFCGLGSMANATKYGLLIAVAVIMIVVAAVLPGSLAHPTHIAAANQTAGLLRMVAGLILLVAVPVVLFGLLAPPEVVKSLSRYTGTRTTGLAYAIDKQSLKSEAESGTFGRMKAKSYIYDGNGNAQPYFIAEGIRVKACNLKGKPCTSKCEGLTLVTVATEDGRFPANGNEVYVSSQAIEWE